MKKEKDTSARSCFVKRAAAAKRTQILSLVLAVSLLAACIVPVNAAQTDPTYSDLVDASQWAHDGIEYVVSEGLMMGVGGNEFLPQKAVTRAMMATVLYRLAGSPEQAAPTAFEDVPSGAWYETAVNWAHAAQIVTGYSEKVFAPMEILTREQALTMLYRFAQAHNYSGTGLAAYYQENAVYKTCFDAKQVSAWAVPSVEWGLATGLTNGVRTEAGAPVLHPKGSFTREQLAVMLYRFDHILKWPGKGDATETEPNSLAVTGLLNTSHYALKEADVQQLMQLFAEDCWEQAPFPELPASYVIRLGNTEYDLYVNNGAWLPQCGVVSTTATGDKTYRGIIATDPAVLQKILDLCQTYPPQGWAMIE